MVMYVGQRVSRIKKGPVLKWEVGPFPELGNVKYRVDTGLDYKKTQKYSPFQSGALKYPVNASKAKAGAV
jgi:hypothetical protein